MIARHLITAGLACGAVFSIALTAAADEIAPAGASFTGSQEEASGSDWTNEEESVRTQEEMDPAGASFTGSQEEGYSSERGDTYQRGQLDQERSLDNEALEDSREEHRVSPLSEGYQSPLRDEVTGDAHSPLHGRTEGGTGIGSSGSIPQ